MKRYLQLLLALLVACCCAAQDPAYPSTPAAAPTITAAEYFIDSDPGLGAATSISVSAAVNISNGSATININGLANGVHRLFLRTRDLTGIWSITNEKDFLYNSDLAYHTAPPAPQNIKAAEYFIDSDPGYGAGTSIPLTPGLDLANVSVSVNTASLSNGAHRLYIRSRNNEGFWSLAAEKDFILNFDTPYPPSPSAVKNITAAEYFFDTDPGHGSGTAIPVTAGTDLSNVSASVNITGLTTGTHRLYIRSKNQDGAWSLTAERELIVNLDYSYPAPRVAAKNITAAEYFFDTDPGQGAGITIPVTAGTDLSNVSASVNTTGLAVGTHRFYMRTHSQDGAWSLTAEKDVIVNLDYSYPVAPAPQQNIVAAEYFIDTNPGLGNGIPIPLTPGLDLSAISITANTSALSNGRHVLAIRSKNQEGRWSLTNTDTFYVGYIPPTPSWTISPAGGHDYGSVQTGSSTVFNFTVTNTGSVTAILNQVVISDTAFLVGSASASAIPVGGSVSIPVTFTPTALTSYAAQLKILSAAGGPDSVTTGLSGTGFQAGTPPGLTYIATAPYSGIRGVSADAGQPGLYTYRILYQSATGRAPAAGYPQVGIDRNGDGDFLDAGEALYTMTRTDSSTNYAAGVTYTYTVNQPDYSNTLGYQFFAMDDQGNAAATGNTAYKSGPVITYQLLDLRIFASDISFSKSNPLPGESFTLTANISNSSAYTATNVPIRFYKDTILLDSAVLPLVNAYGSSSINKVFSFPTDGFYPIKVWIDSSRTLSESNILNNYAIRPINIGKVVLPGGITTTTTASLQSCPQAVLIGGTAVYYGTASPTPVAGAQVTITIGSQTVTTTTDANGNYSYLLTSPACGGTLTYTVSITDFTFTGNTITGAISVPCPAANACVVTPKPGVGMTSSFGTDPCSKKVGTSGPINIQVTYRARNLNNFWCTWDQILKDTVKVFQDGVLIYTYSSVDGTTSPGSVKTFPVTVTLNNTGANVITAEQSYVYDEFFQIPDNFYHGVKTTITGSGSTTMIAASGTPDLQINSFSQSGFTAFSFADANLTCGNAGPHIIQLWDSIPGGTRSILKGYSVISLPGMVSDIFSYSDSTMKQGDHYLTIVTDPGAQVSEDNRNNNTFTTKITVPLPDLSIGSISPTSTSVSPGSSVSFKASVINTGGHTGPFKVLFTADGIPLGNKVVASGIGDKDSVVVLSDPYTVTTAGRACPGIIGVVADVDTTVTELSETNNSRTIQFASDLAPYMLPSEKGSASNPVVVRAGSNTIFHPLIRNVGNRDVNNVTARYSLKGARVGSDSLGLVRAGEPFATPGSFSQTFATAGDYVVQVTADTANSICESNESNNDASFYIRVTATKPDFEVLSQYISPSSLNPNPGQSITIVGTVKNVGSKVSPASAMRFLVDDIQLGTDVPFNTLQPGQDTTVAATVSYSSLITGVKVMKLVADPAGSVDEEREDNNTTTRNLIVGDAPDLARSHTGAITFNPSGFSSGDSVTISFAVSNTGAQQASAWARFSILDANGGLTALDSLPFTLAAGSNTIVSRKMLFSIDKGTVITEIINCSPMEFNLLNNNDTLAFSTVAHLRSATTVNGDLDMSSALPDQLPGWIGGKLMLGNYDLIVNGKVINFDTAHFVITDGTGKLRLVNNSIANIFPIGTSLYSPNFVKIDNAGTPDNFSAAVLPYVLRNGTTGDTVRIGNVNRTWLLEEQTPGGSNVTLELFWSRSDQQSGFDSTVARIAHYTGSWSLGSMVPATVDTNGQFSSTQAGYSSFSPFIVTSGSGIPLPLHWLKFNVTKQGEGAALNWQTTDEVNTGRFIIEHSTDGQTFTAIGEITANNRAGTNDYQFLHAPLASGMHFYRLQLVDLDGSATYSVVRSIQFNKGQIQVFPNPADRMVTVTGLEPGGKLDLLSMDGRLLMEWQVTAPSMEIDLGRVAAGTYLMRLSGEGTIQYWKILKK